MTTDIIDASFHAAAFPSGSLYTGPGTVIGNPVDTGGVSSGCSLYFTSTGNATQINLGAKPKWIKVVNDTDSIVWEWVRGMAATHSIKTTFSGPTVAMDTGSAIVPSEAATNTGNWIVTLSATLCGTTKLICVMIGG